MRTISRLASVTTPDGRTFFGRWPQSLGARGEAPAQFLSKCSVLWLSITADDLPWCLDSTPAKPADGSRQGGDVGGFAEVVLPAGRADVATDTDVYEVEPVRSWRTGARQAFAYGGMSGLRPALALFGTADYEPIYLRIRDRMPGLGLWIWRGGTWERITSRRCASRASLAELGGDAA